MTEIQFGDAQPIESYGPDFVRVAGEVMAAPTLVHATGAVHWGGTEDTETIIALAAELDFILLGTGAEMRHAPAEFRKTLEDAGIGVEVMKTDSACRTYNVLVSEGRRVAAAILPVES